MGILQAYVNTIDNDESKKDDRTATCNDKYHNNDADKGRAVEILCPICPISLWTSKKFQFTCPGTRTSYL